jgi:hypothetical protein
MENFKANRALALAKRDYGTGPDKLLSMNNTEDGSSLMNNNRQPNNNNRRRGRGNNNSSGGNRPQGNNTNRNGFDYQNRIDNRARGNASQMLEKYKKLAADAQHNDDRVNAEYYLQFADHYFRVLADFKSRQEERQEERRPQQRDEAREERYNSRDENIEETGDDQETAEATDSAPEETSNRPQEARSPRQPRKERTPRPPRRHHSEDAADETQAGLDLSVLPPSISIMPDDSEGEDAPKPARKPRARRAKPASEETVATAAE